MDGSPQTHLDYDHRECENVPLPAGPALTLQDLRCSPRCGAVYRWIDFVIEAQTYYARATIGIHHGVRLQALIGDQGSLIIDHSPL